MFIRRITLRNLLPFGPDETDLELGPLNVLIGPNGSGKSNLLAAIGILRAAAQTLLRRSATAAEWASGCTHASILSLPCRSERVSRMTMLTSRPSAVSRRSRRSME
ncbi:MAG: AAA family ATPase [Acidobacteria bacterium]|nr:AAA family ATPase [Acidobacteriota bacterium]